MILSKFVPVGHQCEWLI